MAQLNQDQKAAAQQFFDFLLDPDATEFLIQGSAGTGKTTLVRHIIDQIPKQEKTLKALGLDGWPFYDIHVTATTRKAAAVISNVLNCEPQTIHSLLGLKVENCRETGEVLLRRSKHAKPVTRALVIVDEASFIDEKLLKHIRGFTHGCKILYIGDQYQLTPAQSKGCPVFDGSIPTATLTQIMRNEGTIEKLSNQYKRSVHTKIFQDLLIDGDLVKHVDAETFRNMIEEAYTDPDYTPDKVKILAWTNQRVHQFNTLVRKLKGLPPELTKGDYIISNKPIMGENGKTEIATEGSAHITFISPTENIKGVDGRWIELNHNLEIFTPTDPLAFKGLLKKLAKDKDWAEYYYLQENWGDLRPPYACTVHKSQGSTYERVFIDLDDIGSCNVPKEVARMLYVAVSRASTEVVLCGELPLKYRGATHVQQSA